MSKQASWHLVSWPVQWCHPQLQLSHYSSSSMSSCRCQRVTHSPPANPFVEFHFHCTWIETFFGTSWMRASLTEGTSWLHSVFFFFAFYPLQYMQSRLDAQLFLSMVKQSSTHIHHPLSITISLDHHHNLYQVSQHNLPLIIIDFTSPYFPIVCSAAWSWNIRIGRIWSRWYDITFDSLRLCAGSNMRDEIKSILNLFRQILNTLIVRNGNMWLNLNSWREPGLYGSATHCYLVSTRTRRLDKQDYDDNDGRYMVLMKMILKNMRMMTEGGLKMTSKMLNNSWW